MHDKDVRRAVRSHLDSAHAGDSETLIVEEMGIWAGTVRVDVAVINGEMHGIELKSARDTLDRLPKQATLYSQVFDRVTLVIASNHLSKANDIVPRWWGIWMATSCPNAEVSLSPYRDGDFNPGLEPLQVARILWRTEAALLLEKHNLLRGFRSKSAEALHARLASSLSLKLLRDEVRHMLRSRADWLRKPVSHQ